MVAINGGDGIANIDSFDTEHIGTLEDPVVARSEQPQNIRHLNHRQGGGPQIGRNFYINRDETQHRHGNDGDHSLSSLSGGITTMSKVVGRRYGGLEIQDIENAGGDQNFDDNTTICPDKDEFGDYAYAYAHMSAASGQRRGEYGAHSDTDTSGDCSSQDRSSLSSITNDFVPTYDSKGLFLAFSRKGKHNNSKKKSKQQATSGDISQAVPVANNDGKEHPEMVIEIHSSTPPRKSRAGMPWYHQANARASKESNSATRSNTEDHSGSVSTPPLTPDGSPQSSPTRGNPLGNKFLMSQEHVDSLVQFPSNQLPPRMNAKQMAMDGDDVDSQLYTNDTSNRSIGFGAYINQKFNHTTRRKKIFLAMALIVFMLICIAVIMVAAVSGSKQDNHGNGRDNNIDEAMYEKDPGSSINEENYEFVKYTDNDDALKNYDVEDVNEVGGGTAVPTSSPSNNNTVSSESSNESSSVNPEPTTSPPSPEPSDSQVTPGPATISPTTANPSPPTTGLFSTSSVQLKDSGNVSTPPPTSVAPVPDWVGKLEGLTKPPTSQTSTRFPTPQPSTKQPSRQPSTPPVTRSPTNGPSREPITPSPTDYPTTDR